MVFSLTNYSQIHPLHFHLPFTFYLPTLPTSRFVFVFFVICFVLNSSGSICSAQLLSRMGNALECTNLSRVTSLKKANLPLPSSLFQKLSTVLESVVAASAHLLPSMLGFCWAPELVLVLCML